MNDSVALSLLTLVPGTSGGTETYAYELCSALALDGRFRYVAYLPSIAPLGAAGLPSEIVSSYPASWTPMGRIAGMSRLLFAPGRVRRALLKTEPAVIHFPLSVMLPRIEHPAVVATVHDVQHEFFPQFFSLPELAYRRMIYGSTIRNSARVITGSDHARSVLLERYQLDPSRVVRIHHAIDHQRFKISERARKPFLLYPANRWRHKNHETLFEALVVLRRTMPELKLVLTGSGHEGRFTPEGVIVLGRVPIDTLVELYQSAAAMVYPSLYEGFGLPVLEAMACACPVASSNASSLPEVCGDAAVMFDPQSPAEIVRAVKELLESPEQYAARGLLRASQFTWSATARQHEDVYESLLVRS